MSALFQKSLIVAASGLCLATTAPALAADWSDQDLLDGQCVAYYAADLGASESETVDPGVMALLGYFVGKIEGRNPGFDLVELLTPTFIAQAEESWTAVGARCAEEGARLGESLTSAGQALLSRDAG